MRRSSHRIITCAFKPGQETERKHGRRSSQDREDARSPGLRSPEYGRSCRRSAAQGASWFGPINLDEVMEIIEIRLLNETFAVRLAAERASSAEIMAIRDVLSEGKRSGRRRQGRDLDVAGSGVSSVNRAPRRAQHGGLRIFC